MSHINKKRPNTKLQIIQVGAELFIKEGYSKTTLNMISQILDISTGNVIYHFPTKEHLLAVLVDELFDFQLLMMEQAAQEGKSSLLAYCLEFAAMAAICEESEIARDFYASSYASELTFDIIKENDMGKTKNVFASFCPDWMEDEWRATENIVAGIEYATIRAREKTIPLPLQIEKALESILLLYGVDEDLRKIKIKKVLDTDYRALGRRILEEFKEYIAKVNDENLKNAIIEKAKHS